MRRLDLGFEVLQIISPEDCVALTFVSFEMLLLLLFPQSVTMQVFNTRWGNAMHVLCITILWPGSTEVKKIG